MCCRENAHVGAARFKAVIMENCKISINLVSIIRLVIICWLISMPTSSFGGVTATANQTLPFAVVFNIYWDSAWDSDNPDLTREKIDTVTEDVLNSSYTTPLGEYGFSGANFGGSFLPNSKCVQKAPNSAGFFVPGGPGISQFIQCEHDNEFSLQLNNAVYNVILPESSIENDLWLDGLCNTGVISFASSWHYHGLPDLSIFPWYIPFSGAPFYTILMTNPKCFAGREPGAFFENLTHEMVETFTDPSPLNISIIPPQASAPFTGEIADECEQGQSNPGAGPIQAFINPTSGNGPNQPVAVASYWSNERQTCEGFSDTTVPTFSASSNVANFGPQVAITLVGTGFGFANSPPQGMVTLDDNTDFWQAGNLIDQNSIQFKQINFFPDQITAVGLTGLAGFNVTAVNANLTIWVCNPNSLLCAQSSTITSQTPPACPDPETRNSAGICACAAMNSSGECTAQGVSNPPSSSCPPQCNGQCNIATQQCIHVGKQPVPVPPCKGRECK
jgi:hypothetical protein